MHLTKKRSALWIHPSSPPQDPVQPSLTPEQEKKKKKAIWAWTMYDWGGNSAFATTIMLPFFPFISLNILCLANPLYPFGGVGRSPSVV